MIHSRPFLFWMRLVVLISMWCATPLSAQTAPEPEPDTIVISDTLHHDDVERVSTFTGDVVMTRGQLILHSDRDRKSTRLNSSHVAISYAVFCLKKKKSTVTSHRNTQTWPTSRR